ncbi:hypothetical protein GCM10023210_31160 [Chryseobacterium ginsengisoli]|uniref:Phage head morphogenesis domain-containing protein n=1 Tax=Chryseobacterium ginsengisoli TaxID=363853 RepID=A0ABP9MN43_9FLAO
MVADFSLSRLVENYIEEMFNDKNVSFVNRKKLWEHYNQKLSSGVDIGFKSDLKIEDKDLVKSLKKSVAEFSAFKETSFKKNLEELLVKDGKHQSKSDFKKDALKLSGDYNVLWMETEFDQTIANVNSAVKFKSFEKNVDLYPNLKIVVIHDNRTRADHKLLDGVIRPYYDAFWKTHMTPLDWGCRCDIEQTDEEPTGEIPKLDLKDEFKNNSALSGKVFGETGYKKDLSKAEQKEALNNLKEFTKNNDPIIPKGLEELEKRLDIKIDRDFLKDLKQEITITNDNKQITAFRGLKNQVNIGDAYLKGDWQKKSIFYHEIGHGIDFQNELSYNPKVKEVMNKFREKYSQNKNHGYKNFDSVAKSSSFKASIDKNKDYVDQITAAQDTLMSLNSKFGYGHTKKYFGVERASEKEFLAHCFETKYCGNKFLKEIDNELHDDMINLIEELLK